MITDNEFLSAVLPTEGTYCVAGISNDGVVNHRFVDSISSVNEEAQKFANDKLNAFFAMATYHEDAGGGYRRKQVNAQWLKSFWIDIDCGEGKPYANQEEGLAALRDFIEKTNLPEPFIISSGYGLHVYWILKSYVSVEEWRPVARKLKAACKLFEFDVDRSVMSDSARVLRVPNTYNFKNADDPKEVTINQRGVTLSLEEIDAILSALDLPKDRKPAQRVDMSNLSETAKALLGNKTSKFSKIARRSIKGEGCNAIKEIIGNQEGIDEPLWRAGLSIAWACEDGDVAIHTMSKKHPDYDPDETVEKASLTLGPYTCETIREINPSLCEGCTMKCTSPIQLGSEIKRDESELFANVESAVPESDGSINTQIVTNALYKPPFPYFRGAKGGIYREDGAGDEKVEIQVYEYDLYPIKRINDPNDGESVVLRLHLPQDGVREFTVPAKKLMSSDSFRETLGAEGVVANQKQMKEIMDYTIRFTKELQRLQKAQEARLQFGWSDDKEAFVVGSRAYTKNGIEHNPGSSTTSDLIRHLDCKGSIEEWKSAYNVFNAEGMEPLQIAAGAGFGAPLMPFTGLAGATINLISNESGTGKSTAGFLALSVFGNPYETALIQEDTHLAKLHRIGVMNNLVVMSDEMTNIAPDLLSNMIYSISQGRSRHRMEKDANRERKNITTWKTIFVTNSNASMMSKLSKAKARPDGEMMRLLEIHVKRNYIEGADILLSKVETNYGVAGDVYAQWLIKNRDSIPELLDKQKARFIQLVGKRMEERFWIGTFSAVLVGLRVAKKLELHDYDLINLEKWMSNFLSGLRAEVKSEVVEANSLVGEFLMDHSNGILAVGTKINPRSGDNVWMPSRSAKLVARFELGDNLMFISKKAFREYCVSRQFTESEALKACEGDDAPFKFVKTLKKRMMAGTTITAPGVEAHVFECSPEESAEIFKALEEAERADA